MKKNPIEKRSVDENLFLEEDSVTAITNSSSMELVRVKRDEYTDHKWAPGYVVGTSPQVRNSRSSFPTLLPQK
jgi:hypothetical protein